MSDAKIRITAESAQAEKALGRLTKQSGLLTKALGATAAFLGTRALINYTTQWTDLNSRLKNATGSAENAQLAMASIEKTARKTYSPLAQTADVFIRNSMALNELGYTTKEQIKVSEALNNAIVVSGARGQQAASALDAFAKSIARGKFEGEDFNRIVENSPRLLQAMADGIGVTTRDLRQMVTDGVLTTNDAIQGLISQMGKLAQEADDMPTTISDAFVILENKLVSVVGKVDTFLGTTLGISSVLIGIADSTEMFVGALGGLALAAMFATTSIFGTVTALAALKRALLTSVLGAGLVILGVALGYVADKLNLFGDETDDAAKSEAELTKEILEQEEALRRRQKIMADIYAKAQDRGIKPLLEELELQKELVQATEYEKRVKEELHKVAEKLKITEEQISNANRTKVENAVAELMAKERELSIAKSLQGYVLERVALNEEDLNQREIIVAIRQKEVELNSVLTEAEKKRIATEIEITQQLRKQAEIRDLINQYLGKTNDLQQIQKGLNLLSQADPIANQNKAFEESKDALLKAQEALRAEGMENEMLYNQALLDLEQEHQNKLTDIQRAAIDQRWQQRERDISRELQARKGLFGETKYTMEQADEIAKETAANEKAYEEDKTRFVIGKGVEAFQAFATQSKQAFEAYKALKIAETIMTTYSSATKAYESTVGLPVIGPFLAPVMAAAAIAAGFAQVAQIRSMTYSGRALGGPVMSGQSYMVGERGPELFTPTTSGQITRNQDLPQGDVTVNFSIIANDTTGFDELLSSRQGLIKQIISDAMLERGQRSMM